MTNEPILLRVNEVATKLGLSRSATYQLILTGEIQSLQIGRARRVPLAAVEEWVAQQLTEDKDLRQTPVRHGLRR